MHRMERFLIKWDNAHWKAFSTFVCHEKVVWEVSKDNKRNENGSELLLQLWIRQVVFEIEERLYSRKYHWFKSVESYPR